MGAFVPGGGGRERIVERKGGRRRGEGGEMEQGRDGHGEGDKREVIIVATFTPFRTPATFSDDYIATRDFEQIIILCRVEMVKKVNHC